MNRGIARRTVFEAEQDIRQFLTGVALQVRSKRIEVHAYSVLTTHFHLLLRSVEGELSRAMREIQHRYSRWFNRSRKRDGPVFRGRYRAQRITSDAYLFNVVQYIDHNAVQARLCATPEQYPHASARAYSLRAGPPWLTRSWIESEVSTGPYSDESTQEAYSRMFGGPEAVEGCRLVERRLRGIADQLDPLPELLGGAPEEVLAWMRRKAEVADGTRIGSVVCSEEAVVIAVVGARTQSVLDDPETILVALLRELAGSTFREIANRLGRSVTHVGRRYQEHRRRVVTDDDYAKRICLVAQKAYGDGMREPSPVDGESGARLD